MVLTRESRDRESLESERDEYLIVFTGHSSSATHLSYFLSFSCCNTGLHMEIQVTDGGGGGGGGGQRGCQWRWRWINERCEHDVGDYSFGEGEYLDGCSVCLLHGSRTQLSCSIDVTETVEEIYLPAYVPTYLPTTYCTVSSRGMLSQNTE